MEVNEAKFRDKAKNAKFPLDLAFRTPVVNLENSFSVVSRSDTETG